MWAPSQLRVAGVLIDRGPLALLGLALLQLAAHLDPANAPIQARWQQLGRLGVVAVLGFLLLVPLQLVLGLCFAAATPLWSDSEVSLLMGWQWHWRQRWPRRRRQAAALNHEEYLRQLSKE